MLFKETNIGIFSIEFCLVLQKGAKVKKNGLWVLHIKLFLFFCNSVKDSDVLLPSFISYNTLKRCRGTINKVNVRVNTNLKPKQDWFFGRLLPWDWNKLWCFVVFKDNKVYRNQYNWTCKENPPKSQTKTFKTQLTKTTKTKTTDVFSKILSYLRLQ